MSRIEQQPAAVEGSEPQDPAAGVRWELLLDAVVAMAADLSLDGLLEQIVEVAGRLADAEYAALGVLDVGRGRRLRTFVHHGMDHAVVTRIGDLPSGHGLLGVIIDRPEPLRLHDIAAHPESYGFPAEHPPMRSFLGVPVRTRDKVFGNLYLTEKRGGGDFTLEDERIVVALASAAGVAVENARLYEEGQLRQRWLAATAEITAALLGSAQPEAALQLVADRAREVSGADAAWIVSDGGGPEGAEMRLQVLSGPDVDLDVVRAMPLDDTISREVATTRTAIVVDDLATDPRAARANEVEGWPRLGPAVFVPLSSSGDEAGTLALAWSSSRTEEHQALDAALPAAFAEQAALSLQTARAQHDRQRLAVLEDRDRIGRDLHDLVIQRLFATGLSLEAVSRDDDVGEARRRVARAVDDLDDTIRSIRNAIFELGASDQSADLRAELARLVRRAESTLKFAPVLSIEGPVNSVLTSDQAADLLAVLTEALSNAARHAEAGRVEVLVRVGDHLVLEVVDDGRGIAPGSTYSGLVNLRQRAEARGGTCVVGPSERGGTAVHWEIPLRAATGA